MDFLHDYCHQLPKALEKLRWFNKILHLSSLKKKKKSENLNIFTWPRNQESWIKEGPWNNRFVVAVAAAIVVMFSWIALLHTHLSWAFPCPFCTLLILEMHNKSSSSRGLSVKQVNGSQPWIIYQNNSMLWLMEMFQNACSFLFKGCSEFNFLVFKIIWQNRWHKGTLTVGTSYETRKEKEFLTKNV